MSLNAKFFGAVFGLKFEDVLGDSEFYYFSQTVDENGTQNNLQIRKAKVDAFAKALGPDAGLPGPFITGVCGKSEGGFPEHLMVVPSMGADVVVMYHRDDITDGGPAGKAAAC